MQARRVPPDGRLGDRRVPATREDSRCHRRSGNELPCIATPSIFGEPASAGTCFGSKLVFAGDRTVNSQNAAPIETLMSIGPGVVRPAEEEGQHVGIAEQVGVADPVRRRHPVEPLSRPAVAPGPHPDPGITRERRHQRHGGHHVVAGNERFLHVTDRAGGGAGGHTQAGLCTSARGSRPPSSGTIGSRRSSHARSSVPALRVAGRRTTRSP